MPGTWITTFSTINGRPQAQLVCQVMSPQLSLNCHVTSFPAGGEAAERVPYCHFYCYGCPRGMWLA
jgi:hypothetical protein